MKNLVPLLVIFLCVYCTRGGGTKKVTGTPASASKSSQKKADKVDQDKLVSVGKINPVRIRPGKMAPAILSVSVQKGFHVQSNPAKPRLIPTTLKFEPAKGLKITDVRYPMGKPYRLKGAKEDISVYEGKFKIRYIIKADKSLKAGKLELDGKLRYQVCNDVTCFFPKTISIKVPLVVKKSKT